MGGGNLQQRTIYPQLSGERLQDHWSSGYVLPFQAMKITYMGLYLNLASLVRPMTINYVFLLQVASAAGRVDTLKRVIRRAKRATAPPEPSSVENIPSPLPEVYITMRENGSFLIYDTESQQQRVLVFGSDDGLGLLGNSDTWFMDGTHSTVPSQFAQLLCIRVPLGDRRVIAPYALLPAKSQELYEECLTTVLDACLRK